MRFRSEGGGICEQRDRFKDGRVTDDLLLDPQTFVAESFCSWEKLAEKIRIGRWVGETLRDCDAAGDFAY